MKHRSATTAKRTTLFALSKTSGLLRKNKFITIIASFALIGTITLLLTRAATPSVSLELENGTRLGSAELYLDNTASGGNAVKFKTVNTTSVLNLPRVPWEGGSNYWKTTNGAQFAKADAAGWDDPSFFPIAVFLGKASDPRHVTRLWDAGINVYQAPEHDPNDLSLDDISNAGFSVLAGEEWTKAEVGNNARTVGWFILDECEQGEGSCWLNGSTSARIPYQQAKVDERKSYNDGRFMTANYGNGILRTYWAPGNDMNQFVQMVDVSSADKYTYTSPGVEGVVVGSPDWPDNIPVNRAYSYGWQADQMKRFQNPSRLRPAWTFIETHRPFLNETNARNISPEQIEGGVWSALIHEARGISYFQHNNAQSGCTAVYSIVDCDSVHAAVKKINTKVKALAPVLNSQSYYNTTEVVNGFTYYRYRFNNGTDAMLKTYNGSAYIFAGLGMKCGTSTCDSGSADSTGTKTFTLPTGVNGTSVEVVGENRTIPVTNRTFTDTFPAEYTHHVYKITLQ